MTAARPTGIQFPSAANGSHSTSRAGVEIVAAALHALDPALAGALRAERNWRRNYPAHLRALVAAGLADGEGALAAARAGLDCAWQTLEWADASGSRPLSDAWAESGAAPLATATVRGEGEARPQPWRLPYRGRLLAGDALLHQIAEWEVRHVIEPGAAEALRRCAAHPEWFDLADRTLVLLGAGAEVGPLPLLLRWRANVMAVDVARPELWRRLVALAREGNGVLRVPLSAPAGSNGHADGVDGANGAEGANVALRGGVDLLAETPRVAAWLATHGGPLDVAALAYADGERHVRLALAMDWVVRAALEADAGSTAAWLSSPTDVFAMPAHTARASRQAYGRRSLSAKLLRRALAPAGVGCFQPNVEGMLGGPGGVEYALADSIVVQQGPNYSVAKRLQQWRALEARARGRRVSLNIAPATTTASVTSNPILAAGYAGADRFGIEVFAPETTRALMAALWVHDLRSDEAPGSPAMALAHPWDLFHAQACHGGLWACPYLPRTALPFAAALGWVRLKLGR